MRAPWRRRGGWIRAELQLWRRRPSYGDVRLVIETPRGVIFDCSIEDLGPLARYTGGRVIVSQEPDEFPTRVVGDDWIVISPVRVRLTAQDPFMRAVR